MREQRGERCAAHMREQRGERCATHMREQRGERCATHKREQRGERCATHMSEQRGERCATHVREQRGERRDFSPAGIRIHPPVFASFAGLLKASFAGLLASFAARLASLASSLTCGVASLAPALRHVRYVSGLREPVNENVPRLLLLPPRLRQHRGHVPRGAPEQVIVDDR